MSILTVLLVDKSELLRPHMAFRRVNPDDQQRKLLIYNALCERTAENVYYVKRRFGPIHGPPRGTGVFFLAIPRLESRTAPLNGIGTCHLNAPLLSRQCSTWNVAAP